MMKLRKRNSCGFRSEDGAQDFAVIRSVLILPAVPPALPGRQQQFDVSGGNPRLSTDETPHREPPKHTNMELHRWTSWIA